MKFNYTFTQCADFLEAQTSSKSELVLQHVLYDSRKIHAPESALFFALPGKNRSGVDFVIDAYDKGVRCFVVPINKQLPILKEAHFLQVENVLTSLQLFAQKHREQFSYPVIAITGSLGKTTFKEWAYHCLKNHFSIVRSPKSFNSQLGVALSLLEMNDSHNLAIIEAGISQKGEMEVLEKMIQPNVGIFTTFSSAHRSNFSDSIEHLEEKLRLFSNSKIVFLPKESFEHLSAFPANFSFTKSINNVSETANFPAYCNEMFGTLKALALFFGIEEKEVDESLKTLPMLALRLETMEGINNNIIINDSYNLDKDALREALYFQQKTAINRKKVVVLGIDTSLDFNRSEIDEVLAHFEINQLFVLGENESIPWNEISDSVVLVKAHRSLHFERKITAGKAKKHHTFVEINLSAIEKNLRFYQNHLPVGVKRLCMVKADAYGTGAIRTSQFLQTIGIDYLGVAFADEGIQLRKAGIHLPILVMNSQIEDAISIIEFGLEPAIYSFNQLEHFTKVLISEGKENYPIHLKFDTGMHRLGFDFSEKEAVLQYLLSQPELKLQGVYSHLSDADNFSSKEFTINQLNQFDHLVNYYKSNINDSFLAHILNSEGALNFPENCYDMIRIGISMYGYTENEALKNQLQESISWQASVSQVKKINKGDFIGYSCSFKAEEEMQIAIISVGYADGFRRNLSNGIAKVFIQNTACEVVGRVCMDMIMVNVTGISVSEGESVEIIGKNQSMQALAKQMQTIPYEVLTGMSSRMARVYVEE